MHPDIFYRLFSGGNYALPYLIKFAHPTAGTICLVNDRDDITYNGEHYIASTFAYTPPDNMGSGGTLKISGIETGLIEFSEEADQDYELTVVGLITQGNTIQPIRTYRHMHGTVTYTAEMGLEFSLAGDDRMEMSFTVYTYDTDSNRGNA